MPRGAQGLKSNEQCVQPLAETDGEDRRGNTFVRGEVMYQERLEAAGYKSRTRRVPRALQSLTLAKDLQGVSVVTAPAFFPAAGRVKVQFRGDRQELAVILWDGLDEQGTMKCEHLLQNRKYRAVWCRA